MRLIRIEPAEPAFSITWDIHKRCNYDCMYCSSDIHDTDGPVQDLATLQSQWQRIHEQAQHRGLKYQIHFGGGEPTVNRNFLPFVKWLRENYSDSISMIGFCTNGSASERYYLEALDYVEQIGFSTHTEYMDVERFLDTVLAVYFKALKHKKAIHVHVMEEYWAMATINEITDRLDRYNIPYSIDEIDYSQKTREHPITFKNEPA